MKIGTILMDLWHGSGLVGLVEQPGSAVVIVAGLVLIYLAIVKKFEPLLLLPIGFGAVLANLPSSGLLDPGGLLKYFYFGVESGLFPPIIFLGIGALTDFGPLIASPRLVLLGAAAQFGIFGTLIGATALGFSLPDAASIAIIGGADGPTSIYVATKLSPRLLPSIAVAAYSYMALVPIIQPPIMRLLTSQKERRVRMDPPRNVTRREKVLFPLTASLVVCLILPSATPLVGMLMLGNLFRESGVVERLLHTSQESLLNIVTIFLGLAVGSKMAAKTFLTVETLKIMVLGLAAFSVGTASGVLLGKVMCRLSKWKVNPLIGAAGVSAVPMAARVVHRVGQEEDPQNFLLMHAMAPNVAGVIGSAIAAGVLLSVAAGG